MQAESIATRSDSARPFVVDLDGHVIEPWDLWTARIAEPYRDSAPRLAHDSWGTPRLLVESRLLPTPEGPGRAPRRFMPPDELTAYQDRLQGGRDPHYRIRDMNSEGIDAVLLMPSQAMAVGAVRDPGLAVAMARAYNDWLAEFCSPYPNRLLGAALLPLQDIDAAVSEVRRTVSDLGFRAVFMRPNPVLGRSLADPAYDPIWAEVERQGALLQIHEGCGFSPGATLGIDRFENGFFSHMMSHPFELMAASLTLICGGVLERFPGLRVSFMEAGAGWVPYWLDRMDEHYGELGWEVPWLTMQPSDYFRRQCVVGCDVHERGLDGIIDRLGAGRLVFSTDYPHSDCVFPGAVTDFEARADVDAADRRAILGLNAATLLGLAVPDAAQTASAR